MKTSIENRNYGAVVVEATTFVDLPNCDNVKGCLIFGNQIIVGKDTQPGTIGLYFPVETEIMPALLGPNNLYRKAEYGNASPEAKGGFFEASGRVRCMKFRGHKSEGFFIPLAGLQGLPEGIESGVEFDTIEGIQICRKYIPRHQREKGLGGTKGAPRPRKEDLITDGQFRFHYDTAQLKRNIHKLELDTPISITDKWHGTSVVIGHLLTKRQLRWPERVAKLLGLRIVENEYGIIAASRKVIKSIAGTASSNKNHFYDSDLWSLVGASVADKIPKGFTLYGEIVGFTPEGAPIQKGYTYRCEPGTHRLLVYRITFTNEDGRVYELSWDQLKEYCQNYGLEHVLELYCGTPRTYMASRNIEEDTWNGALLEAFDREFLNKECPHNPKLPAEGIVVRVDRLHTSEAYKLKSFAFLEHETKMLDEGAEDLETSEEVNSLP